ncbi:MAG: peroxide stress protein YaaA [Cytophagales bacterium]|nr:peroxide stress protein YaaA [Rhizobacter sp.]
MHLLVSPAKTLDFDKPATSLALTRPRFLGESAELIAVLKPKTSSEIAELMDLSEALATLNVARYATWSKRFTERNSKPAVLAFNGDVYEGLNASTLGEADLAWAQEHVSILSGLYGLLRPLDRIQPYRLEMGTSLATARGKNLYEFWGDTLARQLNRHLGPRKSGEQPVVVNLASQEYFRVMQGKALKARVIECVFEDWKGSGYKIISFFAKRARGLMLRHAITQRLDDPAGLKKFRAEGYRFERAVSEPDRLVFRRRLKG